MMYMTKQLWILLGVCLALIVVLLAITQLGNDNSQRTLPQAATTATTTTAVDAASQQQQALLVQAKKVSPAAAAAATTQASQQISRLLTTLQQQHTSATVAAVQQRLKKIWPDATVVPGKIPTTATNKTWYVQQQGNTVLVAIGGPAGIAWQQPYQEKKS